MKEMKLADIIRENNALGSELSQNPQYRLAVLSNIMVPQLKETLELTLRREGINAVVESGDYDIIVQNSAKIAGFNAVVIFWETSNLIDGLQYKSDLYDIAELDLLIEKTIGEIDLSLSNLKDIPLVLFNRFSTLLFNSARIRKNNFDYLADQLNSHIDGKNYSNVVLVDIDKIIANVSLAGSADWRFFYSSKSLYTVDFLKCYATYVRPVFMSACGKSKKALVFDCDNTLWKGIVGEDGPEGIKMSALHPEGIVFQEVQSIAVSLASRGVIIGLCSKNNASDVDEIIRNHPDMKLTDQQIVIKKVNWNDKLGNLMAIAQELNIGLDSLVFIDDSDFEVNLVRNELPQVTTLQVPKTSCFYPHLVRESAELFFSLSNTSEDLQKARMYKENSARSEARTGFDTVEEYLRSLQLKVMIYEDSERLIPRIAQLTQKTNQFNLTTKRYVESEIQSFMTNNSSMVIGFSSTDKFGDNGVVGAVIILLDGVTATIDSFLMSCRVIGRNIEYTVADWIVTRLTGMGVKRVNATYLRTLKNDQVSTFYESMGCILVTDETNEKQYMLDTEEYVARRLDYVEVNNGR